MDVEKDDHESKRGRVRQALVAGLGFRFAKGTPEDKAKKALNQICDDLTYLTDENLRRVIGALRTKGEGSSRCFWPPRATFLAFAEAAQPRRLEDAPGVATWFASKAGQDALTEGRLVAEFLFWERYKRPPLTSGDRQTVSSHADEMRTRVRRARFNRDNDRAPVLDDPDFLRWYDDMEARAKALVRAGKAGQAA